MNALETLRSNSQEWQLFNGQLRHAVATDIYNPLGGWIALNHGKQIKISGPKQLVTLYYHSHDIYQRYRRQFTRDQQPDLVSAAASLINLSDLCIDAEYSGKSSVTLHHPTGNQEHLNALEANARLIGYEAAVTDTLSHPSTLLRTFTDNSVNIYDYLYSRDPEFAYQVVRKIISTYPDNPLVRSMKQPWQDSHKDSFEQKFSSKTRGYLDQLKHHYPRLPSRANLIKYSREIELRLANSALRPKEPIHFANPEGVTLHTREETYAYLTALDLLTKNAK